MSSPCLAWLGCSPERVRCPGNSTLQVKSKSGKHPTKEPEVAPRRKRGHRECDREVIKRRMDASQARKDGTELCAPQASWRG